MNLPPKPLFELMFRTRNTDIRYNGISENDFNSWYDNVFKDAVTVSASINKEHHKYGPWITEGWASDTHTALLINITPIIKENEEREIIRSMVEYIEGDYPRMESTAHGNHSNELIRKARAYLESKK